MLNIDKAYIDYTFYCKRCESRAGLLLVLPHVEAEGNPTTESFCSACLEKLLSVLKEREEEIISAREPADLDIEARTPFIVTEDNMETHLTPEYIQSQKDTHVADESAGDAVVRREVVATLPYLKKDHWVLDLGCKTGVAQEVWKENGILNTIGLDLFPQRAFAKGVPVIQTDMHILPFSDEAFDFIYCADTLEHSPYPGRVFAEMYRILKWGGHTIIHVPINHEEPYHWTVLGEDAWKAFFRTENFVVINERVCSNHVKITLQK